MWRKNHHFIVCWILISFYKIAMFTLKNTNVTYFSNCLNLEKMFVLPGDGADRWRQVVFKLQSLCFRVLAVVVPTLWLNQIPQISIRPPSTFNHIVVAIVCIKKMLVGSRHPHPRVVVQYNACSYNEDGRIHVDLKDGQETPEAAC